MLRPPRENQRQDDRAAILMDGDALPWEAACTNESARAMGALSTTHTVLVQHNASTPRQRPLGEDSRRQLPGSWSKRCAISARGERAWRLPPSTSFTVTEEGHVPPSAAARKGIQPVVDLKVNARVRPKLHR